MRTENKESPINIRAKASQKELIDIAAHLLSKSRTDFILEATSSKAEDVLPLLIVMKKFKLCCHGSHHGKNRSATFIE